MKWGMASKIFKQKLSCSRALFSRDRHKMYYNLMCRTLWGYNIEPNIFFWKFGPFWMIISKIQMKWGMSSKIFKQKLSCSRALFSRDRHKMYYNLMCRTLWWYNIEPNIFFWKFGPLWMKISKIHINWSIASKIFKQKLFFRRASLKNHSSKRPPPPWPPLGMHGFSKFLVWNSSLMRQMG